MMAEFGSGEKKRFSSCVEEVPDEVLKRNLCLKLYGEPSIHPEVEWIISLCAERDTLRLHDFGYSIGLSKDEVSTAIRAVPRSKEQQMRQVVLAWSKGRGGEATVERLLESLYIRDEVKLVEDICQRLSQMSINNDRKMCQKHSFVHRLRDYVQGCPSDGEVSSFRKPIDVMCDHHKAEVVVSQPSEISAPFAPIQVSSSESLEPDLPLSLFLESKLHIPSTGTSYIQVEDEELKYPPAIQAETSSYEQLLGELMDELEHTVQETREEFRREDAEVKQGMEELRRELHKKGPDDEVATKAFLYGKACGSGHGDVIRVPDLSREMTESLEYKTVLSCFSKLVTALKLDPLAVLDELVAEGLIPPMDGVIDAQKLASLLLDIIKLSPKRYYDVIKVFSRHEWLGGIVDILQEEHSKLESASVGVQRQGIEEGVQRQGIKEASGDSIILELDCPHRQSCLPIPNPVVRFEELSEDDREDLYDQMHELTKEIYTKFKKLLIQVRKSLKERVEHAEVVATLTGGDAMIFDDDDTLHEAKDMSEVFKAINPHLSYFNYDLLKLLVDVHGTPEDKKCLDEYLTSFASYCRAMPCAEEVCGSDDSRPNRIKIKFKLNFDRRRIKADYVKDITCNIARILKIKPSSLYLCSIKEGCVSLEFLVPSFLFEYISPLTTDQIVSLYSEVKVIAIQCEQLSLHMDVETDAKCLIKKKG